MSAAASPTPYVGLRSFQTADAAWFFGRDQESAALARKIRANRFTAVVGASGSGKSSLVLAGVLPQLMAAGCQSVDLKPGVAPIARLADALAAVLGSETDLGQARRFHFDTSLRGSAFGLADVAASMAPDLPPIILVIDQFEELFRYGEGMAGSQRVAMREEARAFVELLLTATQREGRRLHVVVTMRSDYFGNCAAYQGLAEAVSASLYLVPIPNRDQLETAIRSPLEKAGATIDDGLVQRLLVEVEEEADRLPLLQHCLLRLWQQAPFKEWPEGVPEPAEARVQQAKCARLRRFLDLSAYPGLRESLSAHADEILNELERQNPDYERVAQFIFRALTEIDNQGRAVRRPRTLAELKSETGADPTVLQHVMGPFRRQDTTFLIPYGDKPLADNDVVDISHEALIRSWKQINNPVNPEQTGRPSGWLQCEESDGRTWRVLLWNVENRVPLSPAQVEMFRSWLTTLPGSGWAERHGGNWDKVTRHLPLLAPVRNLEVQERIARHATSLSVIRRIRGNLSLIRESSPQEQDMDWRQAEIYFALEVMDRASTDNALLPPAFSTEVPLAAYPHLESVWLRDLVRMKAYFRYLDRTSGSLVQSADGAMDDYLWACNYYRYLFIYGRKSPTSEFLPVSTYIKNKFFDDAGARLDNSKVASLIENKQSHLLIAGRPDYDYIWIVSSEFVHKFYGNVITAVMTGDESAMGLVIDAILLSEGHQSQFSIMNCFEAAISIYFLKDLDKLSPEWQFHR